jgi:BirA family transcriptional regulator, biotin operon repressor / biotin---[acetyl-CoA-carboxylase] ligase
LAARGHPETIGNWRHLALGDVGSTNTECLARARAGDAGNLWITADRQLQGRGRHGRQWISEPGNLYASALLIDPAPLSALATLPLVAAVAVHRAIEAVLPPDRVDELKIKWPNDMLLRGAKVSGILLESEALVDGRRAVVIGCGVNVTHAPQQAAYRTTTLRGEGAATTPDLLFTHLFRVLDEELTIWNGGAGLARTLAAWRDRAGGVGGPVKVQLHGETIEGRFEGIDATGRLVLQPKDGKPVTIAAGDIFF